GDAAGVILLPIVQRPPRLRDEVFLPGAPRPARVVIVDARVLPAVAGHLAPSHLEDGYRPLLLPVDDVPRPRASPGDPVVRTLAGSPGFVRVAVDQCASLPLVVGDGEVVHGPQHAPVAPPEGPVPVEEVVD